ncbi:MAG: thiamine pyrophosphate-binding protein [Albidovulum sp.]|nr:thiamine pyrophosphate-binding protein [Albidovulum sp.]
MQENSSGTIGSEAIADSLHSAGIDTVFTVAGGHFLPTYNAIGRFGAPAIVAARHELGAGYMASGYALARGRTGVVFAGAPGPGATNLATPVANAMADSIPLLVITAQVDRRYSNRNILQHCDNSGLLGQFCKNSVQAVSASELPNLISTALQIAQSGRPGPVHVDLPQNLQAEHSSELEPIPFKPLRSPSADSRDLDRICELLENCRKPAIVAGHGILRSGSAAFLKELANRIGAPVATSRSGIGCMDSGDPNSVGMLGFYGTDAARDAISEADLVIVAGCALGEQTTFGWKKDLFRKEAVKIQIDIDPVQPNLVYPVDHAVLADTGRVLQELSERAPARTRWCDLSVTRHGPANDPERGLSAATVLNSLNSHISDDAIVTADIGNHRLWVCEQLDITRPERLIQSCEFDAMGFSLPAAIGASIGEPGTKVVSISGDGGFVHTIGELAVARQLGLPVAGIVFVDGALGILRHQAEALYGEDHFVRLAPIDFAKVAEGFGIDSRTIASESELDSNIAWAAESNEPTVLAIEIDSEEVFPPLLSKIAQRRRDLLRN